MRWRSCERGATLRQGSRRLEGGRRAEARAALRAGALRSPAVGAVLLGHDGAAEGDRARARGHSAGAAEEALLHLDLRAGDRMFWFTTTGWMMWNFLIGALFTDAAIVLYDGSPGHPDMGVLWELGEQTQITCMGVSAGWLGACAKAGVEPARDYDLHGAARDRLDRLAAVARELPLGQRARRRSTSGCSPRAAERTCARRSWAAVHCCRCTRANCRRAGLAARWRRGTSSGHSRGGRGGGAGAHPAAALDAAVLLGRGSARPRGRGESATARATSRCTRVSGAMATGCGSRRAGERSSTAARTRRSTARACAWARARSTARRARVRGGASTRSWWTSAPGCASGAVDDPVRGA